VIENNPSAERPLVQRPQNQKLTFSKPEKEPHIPKAPGNITPFSELGTPEEKLQWWAPFGWLLVAFFTLFILAVFVVLAPLLIIALLIQVLSKRNRKFHRDPKSLRIAIIGAGWAGLQCLERFKRHGVESVDVFERYSDIGGTWNSNLRYKDLQIHGSMTVTSFDNFPYSKVPDIQGGKVMGEEVERYIHRFTEAKGLRPHVQFNSQVDRVNYRSDERTATISITDTSTGQSKESQPYDMVIWASMAAYGNLPEIPGSETFNGNQYHTTKYKSEQFDDIIANNKKVIVVGGGKAACDIVLSLRRAGYHNYKWIMRKPYLFYRYEVLLHDGSFINKVRGASYLCTVLWTGVSLKLGAILHWASGHLAALDKPHTDFKHFHGGMLCATQRKDLKGVSFTKGEIAQFKENGVLLKDGTEEECDVVIWATGNRSGIDTVQLKKDGEKFELDTKAQLYNHFIVPEIPAMASTTALWTSFGPMRATNAADLTLYHLCVRKELSQEYMQKQAKRLMSKNSLIHSFIWAPSTNWLQQWVYFHIDLMLCGLTPLSSFLKHALEVFVLSKETPLQFKILPKGHNF